MTKLEAFIKMVSEPGTKIAFAMWPEGGFIVLQGKKVVTETGSSYPFLLPDSSRTWYIVEEVKATFADVIDAAKAKGVNVNPLNYGIGPTTGVRLEKAGNYIDCGPGLEMACARALKILNSGVFDDEQGGTA